MSEHEEINQDIVDGLMLSDVVLSEEDRKKRFEAINEILSDEKRQADSWRGALQWYDEKKNRQRDAIIEEAFSEEGKQALKKALRDLVLSTPYSATIAMMTGRGSLVSPTEAEVQEEIVTSGLTYEEAYSKLHEQNLRKHDEA